MRRKEFKAKDREQIEAFLREKGDGVLTFAGEDGWPRAVPLNFVYHDGSVYFHGSKKGEKMRGLAADPRAEFVVYEQHAIIPSYFTDPVLACPATTYFRSVRIRGIVEQVEDTTEKAAVLQALMTSLQPEGGHAPIDAGDERYAASLRGVSVLRLDAEETTGKFKFGQNLSASKRNDVLQGLAERGLPGDAGTMRFVSALAPDKPVGD